MKSLARLIAIVLLVVPAMIGMTVVAESYNIRSLLQTNCDGTYHVIYVEQCR